MNKKEFTELVINLYSTDRGVRVQAARELGRYADYRTFKLLEKVGRRPWVESGRNTISESIHKLIKSEAFFDYLVNEVLLNERAKRYSREWISQRLAILRPDRVETIIDALNMLRDRIQAALQSGGNENMWSLNLLIKVVVYCWVKTLHSSALASINNISNLEAGYDYLLTRIILDVNNPYREYDVSEWVALNISTMREDRTRQTVDTLISVLEANHPAHPFGSASLASLALTSFEDEQAQQYFRKNFLGKIIVAEDERDIRDLICFTLRFAGYYVISTSNGEEAVKFAEKCRPNMLLLDVRMPRMTGYEVCRTVKANPELKDIPVVFLSAKGQETEIQQGLEAGAEEYLLKPFAPDKLTTHIRAIMRKFGLGIYND
jgi:CheY-like chemotaxis protein